MTTESPADLDRRTPFSLRAAGADLLVREIHGVETLSRPFRFDVHCLVREDGPSARDLLGAAATLTIVGERGVRVVRGVVGRVRGGAHARRGAFDLRVVPRLWALSRGRRSRVFQDKSVPEIIEAVLGEASIDCAMSTSRAYAPRVHCVQYQESDLAFVSRIAAEEGLFYFFRQPIAGRDDKEVTVFGDAPAAFEAIDGDPKVPVQIGGALVGTEHVRNLDGVERVRSGEVLVRAYDQERPLYDLRGDASAAQRGGVAEDKLSTYRHDADAREVVDDGAARRVLEANRREASTADGTSTCVALSAGRTFEVEGHPVEALNTSFAVVRVEHTGSQPLHGGDPAASYENSFDCVTATTTWRPKKPVRKLQQTTETAVVVGPPGEEIHVDAQGRVKVQFPWDLEGKHDENSSCWLRTMQPWAGASWGFQFIPRVGMEVVVVFVAGDVDRPLVAGAVANGVNPMPYALPAQKTQSGIRTRSTPGGAGSNELRFEDAAGAEQIYLHAQKNLDELIEHDHTRTVKHGESIRVTQDREVDVGGSQKRTVAHGDDLNVGDSRTLEVGGDHVRVVNGSEIVEIGKNLVVHVKGKHVMQVDGQSVDGSAPAPVVAPPVAPSVTPPSSPDHGPSPEEQAATAQLLWAVEQLPEGLTSQGAAVQQAAESIAGYVDGIAIEAAGLPALLAAAPERLATSVRGAAVGVLARAKQTRGALDDAIAAARAPGLDEVGDAVERLGALHVARIAAAEETSKSTIDTANGITARAGSAGGGGGATPKWETSDSAAYLQITGKGVIEGTTLVLKVGDSSVEIASDSIIFHAAKVTFGSGVVNLTGSKVLLFAPDVKIDATDGEGGTIVITGATVSISATDTAAINGGVVTLD